MLRHQSLTTTFLPVSVRFVDNQGRLLAADDVQLLTELPVGELIARLATHLTITAPAEPWTVQTSTGIALDPARPLAYQDVSAGDTLIIQPGAAETVPAGAVTHTPLEALAEQARHAPTVAPGNYLLAGAIAVACGVGCYLTRGGYPVAAVVALGWILLTFLIRWWPLTGLPATVTATVAVAAGISAGWAGYLAVDTGVGLSALALAVASLILGGVGVGSCALIHPGTGTTSAIVTVSAGGTVWALLAALAHHFGVSFLAAPLVATGCVLFTLNIPRIALTAGRVAIPRVLSPGSDRAGADLTATDIASGPAHSQAALSHLGGLTVGSTALGTAATGVAAGDAGVLEMLPAPGFTTAWLLLLAVATLIPLTRRGAAVSAWAAGLWGLISLAAAAWTTPWVAGVVCVLLATAGLWVPRLSTASPAIAAVVEKCESLALIAIVPLSLFISGCVWVIRSVG